MKKTNKAKKAKSLAIKVRDLKPRKDAKGGVVLHFKYDKI